MIIKIKIKIIDKEVKKILILIKNTKKIIRI